jgi:hypothetical protein
VVEAVVVAAGIQFHKGKQMIDVSDKFPGDEHKRYFRTDAGALIKMHTRQRPHEPSRTTERCFQISASLCGPDGKALLAPNAEPYIRAPHLLIIDLAHNESPSDLFAVAWAEQAAHMETLAAHLKATGVLDLPELARQGDKLTIPGVKLISGIDNIDPIQTQH